MKENEKEKKEKFVFEAKIKQNLKLLMLDDDFFNDFEKSKRFTHKLSDYFARIKSNKDTPKIINEYNNDLYEEIVKNFKKYNLSSIYYQAIFFLLTEEEGLGDISLKKNSAMRFLIEQGHKNKHKDSFYLRLYPEITLKDIQNSWPAIEMILKYSAIRKTKERKRRRVNIKRDIEIYKLKKLKKTNKQIAEEINKKYSGVIGYEDVPKIIKRIKEEIKSLMGK